MAEDGIPQRPALRRFDSAAADELARRCWQAIAALDEAGGDLRRIHPAVVDVWRGRHRDEFDERSRRGHRHAALVREDLAQVLRVLAVEAGAVAAENRRRQQAYEAELAAWEEAA